MPPKVKELKTAFLRVSVRKIRPFSLMAVRGWLYELDLMKILACLLSLCLVHVAFAQDDPAELVKVCKGDKMINGNGHIGKVTHHNGTFVIVWDNGRHVLSVDPDNRDILNYKNNLGRRGTYERVKW